MDMFTKEVERALQARLYCAALMLALSLPDICAALEAPDGRTTQRRYSAWYDVWMASLYSRLTGDDMYRLRCAVLHQGRFGHPGMQFSRILFTIRSGTTFIHDNLMHDALNLDAETFCRDVVACVRRWYAAKNADQHVIANMPYLVQFHEHGLAPYMVGVPLIA